MKKRTAIALAVIVVVLSGYMAYAPKPEALQQQLCCMAPPPCPPCD